MGTQAFEDSQPPAPEYESDPIMAGMAPLPCPRAATNAPPRRQVVVPEETRKFSEESEIDSPTPSSTAQPSSADWHSRRPTRGGKEPRVALSESQGGAPGKSPATDPPPAPNNGKRIPWSRADEEALRAAVDQYGVGKWAQINKSVT